MAKAINIIQFISCVDLIVMGLVFPKIGVYILSLGGSYFLIGLIGSVVAAIQFIAGPIAGSWSDSVGRVKLLRYSLLANSMGMLISGLSSSLAIFIATRIIWGIFAQTPILTKALIADVVPSKDQAAIFGKMGALGALGFIIGPIVGGHLYERENGYFIIASAASLLLLASTGSTFFLPSDGRKKTKKGVKKPQNQDKGFAAQMKKIFSNLISINWAVFWDLFVLKFFSDIAINSFFPNLVVILGAVFMQSHKNIGYSLGFMSLIMGVSNSLIGKMKTMFYANDDSGLKRIAHGIYCLAISFIGMHLTESFEIYLCWLIPFSVSVAILGTTYTEVIISRADEKEKGKLMGAAESMMPLAGLITPLISGSVSEYFGQRQVILVSMVPALIASAVVAKLRYSAVEVTKSKTD